MIIKQLLYSSFFIPHSSFFILHLIPGGVFAGPCFAKFVKNSREGSTNQPYLARLRVGYLLDPNGSGPQKGGVFAGPRWSSAFYQPQKSGVFAGPRRYFYFLKNSIYFKINRPLPAKKGGVFAGPANLIVTHSSGVFAGPMWGICWTHVGYLLDPNRQKWGICWTHVGYLLDPCGVFAVPKAHFLVKSGVFAGPGGVFAGPKWGICWTQVGYLLDPRFL